MLNHFIIILLLCFTSAFGGSLLNQANQAYNGGRLYEAVKLYRKAAVSGESPALCWYNAANAYYQLDSLPQAVVYYRACIQAAPEYVNGYLNLAVVYHNLNDLGACTATAKRLIKLDPNNRKGRLLLAFSYRETGSLSEAIIEFERLTADFPEMEEPYIALGEIYRDLNDYELSRKWLTSYPQTGKNLFYVDNLLAEMSEQREDLAGALFYLRNAFSLDTTKSGILYRIIEIQTRLGNDLVAYETAREASERFPQSGEIAVLAGNLAFTRGWIEEAQRWYIKADKLGNAQGAVGLQNVRAVRMERAQQLENGGK